MTFGQNKKGEQGKTKDLKTLVEGRRKLRKSTRNSWVQGVVIAGNRHSKQAVRSCRLRKPPGFRESRPAFAQQSSFPLSIGLERGLIEGRNKGNYCSTSRAASTTETSVDVEMEEGAEAAVEQAGAEQGADEVGPGELISWLPL
ncbi:unnamed protein product [Cuscuta europaea]|uniref:Uncharacterized protein n=1 Tax=Cuscuta europaea TaxID=41803 RepID=A0A9P0ZFQ4_CUSEU|nr:unnamed protein product [Cuscuta europaea]